MPTPRNFTDEQVAEFRASELSAGTLAEQNGVTRVTMWRLITGRTYADAPGEPRDLKIGRPRRTDHGHQMSYRRGCRCDKCKCWRKLAARADRARRKAKAEGDNA
jgi:hypothetical protein